VDKEQEHAELNVRKWDGRAATYGLICRFADTCTALQVQVFAHLPI
jgi:hypothetical protein